MQPHSQFEGPGNNYTLYNDQNNHYISDQNFKEYKFEDEMKTPICAEIR